MTAAKHTPTPAGARAILAAYRRIETRGTAFLCPVNGAKANAETMLLNKLRSQGFVTCEPSPTLTESGLSFARAALAKAGAP